MRAWLAAVTAVVVLSGCGTAAPGTGSTAGAPATTGTAARTRGPVAGSLEQARALARRLMDQIPLPAGTRYAAHDTQATRWLNAPPLPATIDALGMDRLLVMVIQQDAVRTWLLAHAPPGANRYVGGTLSTSMVSFAWTLPQPGIIAAEVGYNFASRSDGTTLVREYAHVSWSHPRSAAEHIDPALFGSVTLSADLMAPQQDTRHLSRTFTSPAVIHRLAAFLNTLPGAPAGQRPCPAYFGEYAARFTPVRHGEKVIVIKTYGCVGEAVTVGDADQPALWDPSDQLAVPIRKLLGVHQTES